jgi:hypothetical protein
LSCQEKKSGGYFDRDLLHPLIHTLLEFNLAQDAEKKKAEPVTPHFLSLNPDIVAESK